MHNEHKILGMMIPLNQLDELEETISTSSLSESTKNILNSAIADRRILTGIIKKLLEAPEDSNDEIIQELRISKKKPKLVRLLLNKKLNFLANVTPQPSPSLL